MGYKVAVVGATGNVGREVLQIMAERQFPADEVIALASPRSEGREISYGEDKTLIVNNLETYDFTGTDIVLSSPGASVSKTYSPKAAAAGAVVIDNTSQFRMEPDVPLIVPEVNAAALKDYKKRNIISNPNCSTIQMLIALKPLHDFATIERVVVATYQSVSGAGKEAMDELFNQTKGIFMNQSASENQKKFTKQIAFNIIPHIDSFMDDGYTKEEWKMAVETKKILDPDIKVTATAVRAPLFLSHAEAINIEFKNPITPEQAREILRKAPGIAVVDKREDGGYVTPVEAAGEDLTYVSRIRKDPTVENGLALWVVADNIRKGAALNTVQIGEELIKLWESEGR
ncbi:MAG: aspartate-semialdehyde dehydrogenase [Alphaproteobacteria bacterium]